MTKRIIHNHGTEDGPGLSCAEYIDGHGYRRAICRPRVYLVRFGVDWAQWCWSNGVTKVGGFDTLADTADDARAYVTGTGEWARV